MAKLAWKPWHKVVELRKDLRSGELPLHMFAADLYDVMMQRGQRSVYEKPEEFFALTYPTYNLRELVRDVAMRLAGKSDKVVRQLELTYGGGKTHTLITLYHLFNNPAKLPDLPAVDEFVTHIGSQPKQAKTVCMCFDKLDVEKGMEVVGPDGGKRWLKEPWSVLAFQIAGDEGLKMISANGDTKERDTAPAENLLTDLLALPVKEGLSTLILIDEVLMFAREKIGKDTVWRGRLINFFQYLTQAAVKTDKCCVVVSLLASDPKKSDHLGKEIQSELYDIFQRQREETVQPVEKEDVAELLRRRFFTPESIIDQKAFKPHVMAALKGIMVLDEQTKKEGASAEERFVKSYPFHPDLTEVFYTKWTNLERFQRTRGVLRTFALALRESEKWDASPLIGPNVFLSKPGSEGVSEAARELITVAETEEYEGRRQAWTPILEDEFYRARQIQTDSVGLNFREVEQVVITTFLHSQPIGQSGKSRDLINLCGATRPDRIELKKGLLRWTQLSYWLDDQYTPASDEELPQNFRLGNRPNLNQMHAVSFKNISDDIVEARLFDEIQKNKDLTKGAFAAGVRVHTLPEKPGDVKDNGEFRFTVLGPSAVSESGKPSPEAKQYIDYKNGSENPRVFRNAVVLVTPSKEGIDIAKTRIRNYLAWEDVQSNLKKQEGSIDAVRMQMLIINIDKAKKRIPEAILQAYCIVVTVSEKDEIQAFKISVNQDSLFNTIKADTRTRIQETAITAETLLPGGPYNLWREGEPSRRVKDLVGAFAQLPRLPKMLNTKAILDTLIEGCIDGTFVLKLARPDRSFTTWWRTQPEDAVFKESALEVFLPQNAELSEIPIDLIKQGSLPDLWKGDEIKVKEITDYFSGSNVVMVQKEGYQEPATIPKVSRSTVEAAIKSAVQEGVLWLLAGPASILGEEIPEGILSEDAILRMPPQPIPAPEILSENMPTAWKSGKSTALSIHTALSNKAGAILPWKTVRQAITDALRASFIELEEGSSWPCDQIESKRVTLKESSGIIIDEGEKSGEETKGAFALSAIAELEPSQIQDLGDIIPKLLDIKAKKGFPIKFRVQIMVGEGDEKPDEVTQQKINDLLSGVDSDLELK